MAINLKKFASLNAYNDYIASGGTKPKAYLITETNTVYYTDEAQGRTEEFDGYAKSEDIPTKTSQLTNDSGFLTAHQDISGKADKATTLAGYGITDAKISSGRIILGSNAITPLTAHQDISGKANKATTLAGYGITDAKIANNVITLGSNTVNLGNYTKIKTISKQNESTIGFGTGKTSTTISITMAADTFYIVGRVNGLTLTLPSGSDTDCKEYSCQFYVPDTSYTLTLPSTVYWQDGKQPSFEANTCCQLVIINNCATIGTFKAAS